MRIKTATAIILALCILLSSCSECEHGKTHTDYKEPTCAEAGYEDEICDKCGVVLKHTAIEKLEHAFEISETVSASCSNEAYVVEYCRVCGKKNKRVTGQRLKHRLIKSKEEENWYVCELCGLNFPAEEVAAAADEFEITG